MAGKEIVPKSKTNKKTSEYELVEHSVILPESWLQEIGEPTVIAEFGGKDEVVLHLGDGVDIIETTPKLQLVERHYEIRPPLKENLLSSGKNKKNSSGK